MNNRLIILIISISAILLGNYFALAADIEQGFTEIEEEIGKALFLTEEDKNLLILKVKEANKKGISSLNIKPIIERGLSKKIKVDSVAGFLDVIIKGKEQELPVYPLVNKTLEGLSKNVSSNRILKVMQNISEEMKISKDIVEKCISHGIKAEKNRGKYRAIQTIAETRQRGIAFKSINRMVDQVLESKDLGGIRLSNIEDIVETLADLVDMGMSENMALKAVGTAIAHGYINRDELMDLEDILTGSKQRGVSFEEMIEMFESGKDMDGISRDIRDFGIDDSRDIGGDTGNHGDGFKDSLKP